MENSIQIASISGVSCYEESGTAYLKLDDVARGLGFTQTQKKNGTEYTSIRWERVEQYLAEIGFPHKWGKDSYIPENVFYRLAMKAKNEVAEKFQALVADEIIPSIRKNGAYIAGQESMTQEELIAQALIASQKILKEREARIARLNEQVGIMQPKADYYDNILNSTSLVSTTEIAKDYGMSAFKLNKLLNQKKVQYKVNKTWVLYDKYANQGYTGSKTYSFTDSEGANHSSESTFWTQKGRKFIYDLLKTDNIIPVIERIKGE